MKNKKKMVIKGPKRNLFTLLIIVGGLLVAFFIAATITSYASLDKHMYEPFNTENATYNLKDAEYINGKEFNDFGLEFICSEFDNGKAKFKIRTYKLENQELELESITIRVCLTADYIDYCKYSSENTKHELAESYDTATTSKNIYTYTVDLVEFPAKVDAFPFDIKVDAPTAYVYLQYKYKNGVNITTKTYVLEYDYSDFNVQIGGISK